MHRPVATGVHDAHDGAHGIGLKLGTVLADTGNLVGADGHKLEGPGSVERDIRFCKHGGPNRGWCTGQKRPAVAWGLESTLRECELVDAYCVVMC
eukprot:1154210-Pelagomonas_calceolata.AAC.9